MFKKEKLWQPEKDNAFRMAAGLCLLIAVVFITFLIDRDHPNSILVLFVLPTAAASFVLSPNSSLYVGAVSVISYSIYYFAENIAGSFNFVFVFSIIVISLASRAISKYLLERIQELEKSEQKSIDLLEKSPSFIYIISGENPSSIRYASPMVKTLLGYTPQEWMQDPQIWNKCIYEADKLWVEEAWNEARRSRHIFHAEYRMNARDGRIVWVSDDAVTISVPGEPIRIQGSMLDITARKRYETVQAVIYQISQSANSARNLEALFSDIHKALSSLMHADNIFVALYDPSSQTIEFPYWVDQLDPKPPPQPFGNGLTEYVLRTGQPLFANPEKFEKLVINGEIDILGSPSVDWLGVPLKIADRTIGVLAVQSYTEGIRFNEEELAILTFVSNQIAMAIERRRSDDALQFSERLYHTTIDSLSELIHVIDQDQRLLMQNRSFVRRNERLGMPVDILGKTLKEVFKYLTQADLDRYQAAFETGTKSSMTAERSFNGEIHYYDSDILPIIRNEHVDQVVTVLRDVTEEKLAEQKLKMALAEKETLLREVHHRVKNNLQVITSLLSLQADYIEDPHTLELFRETQARLRSMALIHQELYQSKDLNRINFHEYIEKLISNLVQVFSINSNVQLLLDIEEVYFNVDTAIPLGLIINELVTNSLKYAFPNYAAGNIRLCLKPGEQGADGSTYYVLIAEDDGIGIPEPIDFEKTESLGLQLVNILVNQLKGIITLEKSHGSRFTIRFAEKPL
jgi:PAS domain S-box-containing protein